MVFEVVSFVEVQFGVMDIVGICCVYFLFMGKFEYNSLCFVIEVDDEMLVYLKIVMGMKLCCYESFMMIWFVVQGCVGRMIVWMYLSIFLILEFDFEDFLKVDSYCIE